VNISEAILTTFKLSVIVGGSWGSSGNWIKPETKLANLACPDL